MKLDVLPQGVWEDLNRSAQETLGISQDYQSRCYQGLAHALHELVIGSAQFFSHKRSIGVVRGGSYIAQTVLPYFYKEGYQVQFLDIKDIVKPEEWVAALNKDICLVLFPEDHPVTAELYSWQKLDQLLNDKKVFSLRVSHQAHWFQKTELLSYSARFCSVDHDLTITHSGTRVRPPALIAPFMAWSEESIVEKIKLKKSQQAENKALVENFEAHLPQGFQALLATENRIFDRALIYNLNLNGEALLKSLPQQWQLETTSLCYHGGLGLFDDWWQPRPSDEVLRGLLLIGAQNLADKDCLQILEKATYQLI